MAKPRRALLIQMGSTRVAAKTADVRVMICVGEKPAHGSLVRSEDGIIYEVEQVLRYPSNHADGAEASYFGLRLGGNKPLPRAGTDLVPVTRRPQD